MLRRLATLLVVFSLLAICLSAQGLETQANRDDWEEINFEFNSSVLVDGFPSLLRLADLLQKNPTWKLRVVGHADHIGNTRANEKLGMARANTIKTFLTKYGARADQVEVGTQGEEAPKAPPKRKGYSRTDEGRWMNRRVTMTLTDAQGNRVGAGITPPAPGEGISDLLKRLDKHIADQEKCCSEILKRLDKLDEIAKMLEKLTGLEGRIAQLEAQNKSLQDAIGQRPTSQQVTEITTKTSADAIEKARMPKYSTILANAGLDSNGELTFTGRGRFFAPFKEQFAFQAQGEYMYFRDRQEGQFDLGLVNRFTARLQAGLFGSFKHVHFSGRDPGRNVFTGERPTQFEAGQLNGGGLLGQAALSMDYLFARGRVGVFGTKGFLNEAVLNRVALSNNVFNELYARVIDQVGLSALVGLKGDVYAEGNFGYLKSRGNADRPGGTLRFVFPLSERFAFTVEGGMNETFLGRSNSGRVVAGFQFGNFMRPKDYVEGFNGIQHAVPVDVPRVRYEVLTRRIRTGNDAPVADAGPDQIGVAAGTITLDGSASFDPDGDPITYSWDQIAGNAVSVTGRNMARATFTAAEGQRYSFRLTVRDDSGAQSIDRVDVVTEAPRQVRILRFQGDPNVIDAGQSSVLSWQVENADSVEIVGIGPVNAQGGTTQVTPNETTQYTMVARNRNGEVRETLTITVRQQQVRILTCTAQPMNIMAGESATLFYATENAEEVNISGIGNVEPTGTRTVTPTQTTTYTITARGRTSSTTCSVTIQVTPGAAPRILSFTANPAQVQRGNPSTLSWAVENATSVSISQIGTVQAAGSQSVSPTQTTTYTLTARNANGEVTAAATVTVTDPPTQPSAPTILNCSATPTLSPAPGTAVVLNYTTTNATSVEITGVGTAPLQGPFTVRPGLSTLYTITVRGQGNLTASCQIDVRVTVPDPPQAIISGPQMFETIYRELVLDASPSINPGGGPLTYFWEPLETGASVLDQGQVRTRIQIAGLFGDYRIRLTVRDQLGRTASTLVTVQFRRTTVF